MHIHISLAIKDEKSGKNPQQNPIHQVTICAKKCDVIIIAVTNGCKNTIWLLFLPSWWEQNWCRRTGLQTKKVNKQIPLPFGTQIWENAIRKNQVWENGTELFRRGKRTTYKENKRYKQGKRGCKNWEVQVTWFTTLLKHFLTSVTQLNSVKLN